MLDLGELLLLACLSSCSLTKAVKVSSRYISLTERTHLYNNIGFNILVHHFNNKKNLSVFRKLCTYYVYLKGWNCRERHLHPTQCLYHAKTVLTSDVVKVNTDSKGFSVLGIFCWWQSKYYIRNQKWPKINFIIVKIKYT